MHAIALEGCTDTVRESALKVDSGRKIPCRTEESNLLQRRDGPISGVTVRCSNQLSYIAILLSAMSARRRAAVGLSPGFSVRFVAEFITFSWRTSRANIFPGILWNSSAEMYQVNKLLAFVVPIRSMTRFLFIRRGRNI